MFAPAPGDLWSPPVGARAVLAPMPVTAARAGSKPVVGKPRPEANSAPPMLTPGGIPDASNGGHDALSAVAALKKRMLPSGVNVLNRGRDMQPRPVEGPVVATGRSHSMSPVGHRHVDTGRVHLSNPLSMSPQGLTPAGPGAAPGLYAQRQSVAGLPRLAPDDPLAAFAADSPVPIFGDDANGSAASGAVGHAAASAASGGVAFAARAAEDDVSEGEGNAPGVGAAGGEKGGAGGKRRGRISVVVRKRPVGEEHADCIQIVGPSAVHVEATKQRVDLTEYVESHAYDFDSAFDENTHNPEIYANCARPLIDVVFNGGSASCFAYGQTGSGKTHTMIGSDADPGLYILAAQDIFARLQPGQRLHVALYEIYCNSLFDLLNGRAVVIAREDANKRVNICGLTWHEVTSVRQLVQKIENGTVQRRIGSTSANEFSSRSHAVVTLTLRDDNAPKFSGCLNIVDLAGSERAADTAANDRQTRLEGAEINKSLLALKECIRGLDERKKHIPFRGSKLTEVLRDSFVGMSKTVMIATISPAMENVDHTLNTLRYAFRVKGLSIDVMQPSKERNAPRPAPQVMRSKSTDTPRQSLAAALAVNGAFSAGGVGVNGGKFDFHFGSPNIGAAGNGVGGNDHGGGSNPEDAASPTTTDDLNDIDPESGRRRRSKREKVSSHRRHRRVVRTNSEMPPLVVADRDQARVVERAVMQVVETRISREVNTLRQEMADMRAEKANDRRTISQLQDMNRLLLQRMEDLCRAAGVSGGNTGNAGSNLGLSASVNNGGGGGGASVTAFPTSGMNLAAAPNSVMTSGSMFSMAPFTRPTATAVLAPMQHTTAAAAAPAGPPPQLASPSQQQPLSRSINVNAPLVALQAVDAPGTNAAAIGSSAPSAAPPAQPLLFGGVGLGSGDGQPVVVSGRSAPPPLPSHSVFSSVPVLPPINQHHYQQQQQPMVSSSSSAAAAAAAGAAATSSFSPNPAPLQQQQRSSEALHTPRDDHAASTHQFHTFAASVAAVEVHPRSRSANRRRESTSSSPTGIRHVSPQRR